MKTLGIIGGLGPMATAYFMELVTGMTDVDCDQKHIPIVLQIISGQRVLMRWQFWQHRVRE